MTLTREQRDRLRELCVQSGEYAPVVALLDDLDAALAENELIGEESADNVRLLDKIADFLKVPHDQELEFDDVRLAFDRAESELTTLRAQLEDARRALGRLRTSAAMLQQHAEADCRDRETGVIPAWLSDTAQHIAEAARVCRSLDQTPAVSEEGETAHG